MRPRAELLDEYWYYFVQRLWGVVLEFRTFFVFDLSRVGTLRTAFHFLSVELLVLLASQKLFWAAFVPSAQITSAWVRRTMRPEDQGQGRVRGYSARFQLPFFCADKCCPTMFRHENQYTWQ